ncbi:MAG: peptide-methionine (S)-S-oxide reductase MsrA [Hyphomicrobiaceae bacterium]
MKRWTAVALRLFAALALIFAVGHTGVEAQAPSSAGKAGSSRSTPAKTEVATFAGGCFWCVEADFDKVDGVLSTVSGYMGGTTPKPTYAEVSAGGTGHLEVVKVTFDPARVSYMELVEKFWKSIDPYDAGGQFCDRGESYHTAIFTYSAEQKQVAEASKKKLQASGPRRETVETAIRDAGPFTKAEDVHQNFYMTHPLRYKFYRYGCGRDQRLEAIWGKKAGH